MTVERRVKSSERSKKHKTVAVARQGEVGKSREDKLLESQGEAIVYT